MSDLPPVDVAYYDEAAETLPRDRLEDQQCELLLEMLAYAYEHAPLVRETWDTAGVHPRDVRSLDDFRALAPCIDKDAVRRFRDERADPYGGLLCVEPSALTAIMSTSGTTGDPTLVPEQWGGPARPAVMTRDFWGMGVRPGDYVTLVLFTFRGPTYGFVQGIGAVPILLDFHSCEMERLCELSLEYRPAALYNFGSVLLRAVGDACERRGFDPVDVFSSYRGVVFAGEPLSTRTRLRAEEWGIELFEHSSVGDVTASFECDAHDGLHFWEDTAFVEGLALDGSGATAPDGTRCELVATSLVNRVAPLIRYRSDDIVRLTRERCVCGRTHARMWPVGRRSDEVVVDGRAVLPVDVWDAVESVEACAAGLFQVVRPAREVDRLGLRVGYQPAWRSRLATARDDVVAAVAAATGLEPDVELVPDADLLRLGPPHKIPRVVPA